MPVTKFYGKYRAIVVNINDPEMRGRIRVTCPKVLGSATSAWCEVCIPYAGDYEGDFYLPKVGEAVWLEFEEGDSNRPVYVGGWFSAGATPQRTYTNASSERIISFKGTKILLKDGLCEISMFDNTAFLTVRSNSVDIEAGGVVLNLNATQLNKLKTLLAGGSL